VSGVTEEQRRRQWGRVSRSEQDNSKGGEEETGDARTHRSYRVPILLSTSTRPFRIHANHVRPPHIPTESQRPPMGSLHFGASISRSTAAWAIRNCGDSACRFSGVPDQW